MLEFKYIEIFDDYVRIYKDFLLPAIICDTSFKVYKGNSAAKNLYPRLADDDGIIALLSEFDADELVSRLKRDGSVRLDGVLAFSNAHVSLTPILHNSEIAGIIVIIVGPETVITPRDVVKSSRTPFSFESGIRQSVGDIFKILDSSEYKANMLEDYWIIPSLQDIKRNSYFILRIASNISIYTQLQSQTLQLNRVTIDLFDLIRQYSAAITGLAGDMGISVRFDLPDAAASFVSIDVERFQLVFFNILHNALYFTRAGNEIEISGISNSGKVILTVRDKGAGIPGEVLPMVFKPYFSHGHNGKPAGIGLGLALAKAVVDAHGGSISVESEDGAGTLVTISMPAPGPVFSTRIPFAQEITSYNNADRFSSLYVGLVDAFSSPYREE